MKNLIALDCETTGLNPWTDKLLGYSISTQDQDFWIKNNLYSENENFESLLRDPIIPKVGHNLRFDLKFLTLNGITVAGSFHDTLLMAQLIDENQPLGLKPLSRKYLGSDAAPHDEKLTAHLSSLKLSKKDLGDPRVDKDLLKNYAMEDTRNTLKLFHVLWNLLTPAEKDYYLEEMIPCERVLLHMELRGVRVDLAKLATSKEMLTTKIAEEKMKLETFVKEECDEICETLYENDVKLHPNKKNRDYPIFNWNSSPQKVKLFYGKLGLGRFCRKKTKTGVPALKGDILRALNLPEGKLKACIDVYLDHQVYNKLKGTYVEGVEERLHHGFIHGEFSQAAKESMDDNDDEGGTVTGRISHSNPNLANLPSRQKEYWKGKFVKDYIIPDTEEHCWLSADYSQIELRVAAHLSQDPVMISDYNDGRDIHAETRDYINKVFKMDIDRAKGKTINFAIIFGAGGYRLCQILGWDPDITSLIDKADSISDSLLNQRFRVLGQWIRTNIATLSRNGYVMSMHGRKRRLPGVFSTQKWEKNHAIKQGGNFVVQCVAASICKRAMADLMDAGFDIRNQIHDQIFAHVKRSEVDVWLPRMKSIMESVVKLSVPIVAEPRISDTFLVKED